MHAHEVLSRSITRGEHSALESTDERCGVCTVNFLFFIYFFIFFLSWNVQKGAGIHPCSHLSCTREHNSSQNNLFLFFFVIVSDWKLCLICYVKKKKKKKKKKRNLVTFPLGHSPPPFLLCILLLNFWKERERTVHSTQCMYGWGVHPHGTPGHCTKGTLFTRGLLYFNSTFI